MQLPVPIRFWLFTQQALVAIAYDTVPVSVIRRTTTVSGFVLNWTIPVQMKTANINMVV
jgi:hypothetical protein